MVLLLTPVSTTSLQFIYTLPAITMPTNVSATQIQVRLIDLPTLPDLSELKPLLEIFYKYKLVQSLNQDVKTLLLTLLSAYEYSDLQLKKRRRFFQGPPIPTTAACTLDISFLTPELPAILISYSKLLSSLTPQISGSLKFDDVSDQSTQTLIGTIVPLLQFFSYYSMLLDQESDFLLDLQTNNVPPYLLDILQTANCLVQNVPNNVTILSFQPASAPVISLLISQTLITSVFFPVRPTPFFNFHLNISNSIYPTYQTVDNSLVYFPCDNSYSCQPKKINTTCLHFLKNKDFSAAIVYCDFFQSTETPVLTDSGLLVPASFSIDITQKPNNLPFLLHTNTPVTIYSTNLSFTFGSTTSAETSVMPFYLDKSEATSFLSLLNPSNSFYSPTFSEKITYGVTSSLIFLMVSFLAIFTKYKQTPTLHKSKRPAVIFRVAASRPHSAV